MREWLQFWSQFKNIHEDLAVTKEDKFQYLIQAMVPETRASELLNSYPPTADNYDKVIASLKIWKERTAWSLRTGITEISS